MLVNVLGIACMLGNYNPEVIIEQKAGENVAEFGGMLPKRLVDTLSSSGATVYEYKHKGNVDTAVVF